MRLGARSGKWTPVQSWSVQQEEPASYPHPHETIHTNATGIKKTNPTLNQLYVHFSYSSSSSSSSLESFLYFIRIMFSLFHFCFNFYAVIGFPANAGGYRMLYGKQKYTLTYFR